MRECSPPQKCHMSHVMCHVSRFTCHVSRFMCHVSCVTCHVSRVTCHLSPVTCHFFLKHFNIYLYIYFFYFKKNGGASWWRVCYQRGLPRLFLIEPKCVTTSQNSVQVFCSTMYCYTKQFLFKTVHNNVFSKHCSIKA